MNLITTEIFKLRFVTAVILFSVDIIIISKFLNFQGKNIPKKIKFNKAKKCQLSNQFATEILSEKTVPYIIDNQSGIVYKLKSTETLIGRDSKEVDFCLEQSTIGRKHCKILKHKDEILISDLLSVNGTFVNDERIAPRVEKPLKHGDKLTLADVDLQYFAY